MYDCNDKNYYDALDEHGKAKKKDAPEIIFITPFEASQIIDPRLFLPLELFSDRVDDD